MGARIDQGQDFSEIWNLPGESKPEPENDTPFPDGSYEHLYWKLYKQIYIPICQHASDGNINALKWHIRVLELLTEQVQKLIAEIEASDK